MDLPACSSDKDILSFPSVEDLLAGFGNIPLRTVIKVQGKVQVMEIKRFLADPTTRKWCCPRDVYLYEVVVWNGKKEMKIVVHARLVPKLQRNALKRDDVIEMTLRKVKWEIGDLQSRGTRLRHFLQLMKFEIPSSADEHEPLPPLTRTKSGDFDQPVIGWRVYYMDVWNDAQIDWRCNTSPLKCPLNPQVSSLPLFARVVALGKTHHRATEDDRNPYSFRICAFVAIGTECNAISVWDAAAIDFINKDVTVGSIIHYYKSSIMFNRNPNFNLKHRLRPNNLHLVMSNNEIKFNTKFHRERSTIQSVVEVVQFTSVPHVRLPLAGCDHYLASEIGGLPHGLTVDVVGVVCKLTRFERRRKKPHSRSKHKKPAYGYWVQRWVAIMDEKQNVVNMEIFVNNQFGVHRKLALGDLLVCTNMIVSNLSRVNYLTEELDTVHYLSSTNETQMLNINEQNRHNISPIPLEILAFWRKRQKLEDCLETIGEIGGDARIPSPLFLPLSRFSMATQLEVYTEEQWNRALDLDFCESNVILIKAKITKVFSIQETYYKSDEIEIPHEPLINRLKYIPYISCPLPFAKGGSKKPRLLPLTCTANQNENDEVRIIDKRANKPPDHYIVRFWATELKKLVECYYFPTRTAERLSLRSFIEETFETSLEDICQGCFHVSKHPHLRAADAERLVESKYLILKAFRFEEGLEQLHLIRAYNEDFKREVAFNTFYI